MSNDMELNPFIVNQPLEAVALPKKVAVKESDDLSSPIEKLLDTHYLHDRQEKTSVYRYNKEATFEVMYGRLTDKSRSLFMYITYMLPKNTDYINLSAAKVRKDIGMSARTLTDAIKELRSVNIITFKSRSVYWVNPMYLFNGNRIEYYRGLNPSNVVVRSIINR